MFRDTRRTVSKFDDFDILVLFVLLGQNNGASRKDILEIYEVGEGSVKSMLNFLEDKNLIEKKVSGNFLTQKGEETFENLNSLIGEKFTKLPKTIFKEDNMAFALELKNFDKSKLDHLYKARDNAIRCGCMSAMILEFKNGKISIPNLYDYDFNDLLELFEYDEKKLLILTSGLTRRICFKGIITIALYLSEELSKINAEIFEY